ncbi:MAG: type I-F CRISPR-associated protein Csy3 [Lautropia sp.]|nr:type I-F CRISPR-associated protein Csy3 [Lautropia sp.]
MSNELKTASVLAFERKLDPSDGVMHAGRWDERDKADAWVPVQVREKSVRGTISNRLKAKDQDPAKLDKQIESPNLQKVDVASLPHQMDTLKLSFTLKVLSGVGEPSACNSVEYKNKLLEAVRSYVSAHGYGALAQRYAANIANARFLWRNRIGAERVEVRVRQRTGEEQESAWRFQALDLDLRSFDALDDRVKSLAKVMTQGFSGEAHVLLEVEAFAKVGAGQEVFPSQELILGKSASDKSKTLYAIGGAEQHVAAIHSQKIGNALRTIDDWYEGAGELGPIAVEPYGSVTTQGKAYRQPKQKIDFYNLLDAWVLRGKVLPVEQQHFVIATLIRGGVFGDSEK